MINLNKEQIRDKIYACWIGKNIGGTIGTPYEGKKQINDVKGFANKPGSPLPNDDLDLQLIWLKAIRENGPQKLNERILGEYWQDFIPPNWNEYGICKANMRCGLVAPLSGDYNNEWKHSNGAWIRTEIWACLNPCCVSEAVRYSYMDACVDHGIGEGTYAAAFVAAMESSAFVIDDIRELIEIGLSNIPETCRVYKFVKMAVNAFDEGKSWVEAREMIVKASLEDEELGWFQAPANVAYTIIGLLYGGCDMKQSIIIAVNCGDDTDCTGATAGALIGLMYGSKAVPDDWREYIGDSIVTVAINRGSAYNLPTSCSEFTDAIVNMHPVMLHNSSVTISDEETAVDEGETEKFYRTDFSKILAAKKPYSLSYETVMAKVDVTYSRQPDIAPGEDIDVEVSITGKFDCQHIYDIDFVLPEGWSISGGKKAISVKCRLEKREAKSVYTIHAGENVSSKNRIILSVACTGRSDSVLIPLVIMG